jgi:hypothetical protein
MCQLFIGQARDAVEVIRQGLGQAKQSKGRDVKEFFAEFEAAHGIPH